jgi:TorA maturation chaperone TorD
MSARVEMGDGGPGGGSGGGNDGATLALYRTAAADDLRLLASLHDRELDGERIHALWQEGYEDFLAVHLLGEPARRALSLLRAGLTDIPVALDAASLDRLAADYADIYLTNGLRASPCESVWLDEDGLVMQGPMFDVRAFYSRHGLAVPDWRRRSDDHLVHQLQFLAYLLAPDEGQEGADLTEVAHFLDQHPLLWIDRFAERVAARCETRFYAGLALLTAAYLDELRGVLADLAQVPRPSPEEMEARRRPAVALAVPPPSAFVPGSGPVW